MIWRNAVRDENLGFLGLVVTLLEVFVCQNIAFGFIEKDLHVETIQSLLERMDHSISSIGNSRASINAWDPQDLAGNLEKDGLADAAFLSRYIFHRVLILKAKMDEAVQSSSGVQFMTHVVPAGLRRLDATPLQFAVRQKAVLSNKGQILHVGKVIEEEEGLIKELVKLAK